MSPMDSNRKFAPIMRIGTDETEQEKQERQFAIAGCSCCTYLLSEHGWEVVEALVFVWYTSRVESLAGYFRRGVTCSL